VTSSDEEVTLRYVRLRDYDGNVHFVPNGSIPSVISMGRGHAYAVMDVGVAYGTDLDHAMSVMQQVADQLMAQEPFSSVILAPFDIAGVEQWGDSAIVIRARFKVAPLAQWNVRRAYLKLLKAAFDDESIEIPFPHIQLVTKGSAPSLSTPPLNDVDKAAPQAVKAA